MWGSDIEKCIGMNHEWVKIGIISLTSQRHTYDEYICNKCGLIKIEYTFVTLKKKVLYTDYYFADNFLFLGNKELSCGEMIIKDILQ